MGGGYRVTVFTFSGATQKKMAIFTLRPEAYGSFAIWKEFWQMLIMLFIIVLLMVYIGVYIYCIVTKDNSTLNGFNRYTVHHMSLLCSILFQQICSYTYNIQPPRDLRSCTGSYLHTRPFQTTMPQKKCQLRQVSQVPLIP